MNAAPRTPYHMLSELLDNPEMLQPPRAVIARLAYAGRLTLLAAAEKSGKSTLIGQAAAAIATGGRFLGEFARQGAVVWVGLDEATGDIVRRFSSYGVRDGVVIFRVGPRLGEWPEILAEIAPQLVVIDTLSEYASEFVEDIYKASDWVPVLKVLREAAEASGAAFVLLHHMTRNGNRYADSRQLGAGVDVIAEMLEDGTDLTARKLKVRGRVGREDFTIRYEGERYTLVGGELPLEIRTYRAIEAEPGISNRRLREVVYGANRAIDAAVRDLLAKDAIENRGPRSAAAYHVKIAGARPGTVRGTVDDGDVSACGQTPGELGRTAGHDAVPHPLKGVSGARSENGAPDAPAEVLL